MVNPSITINIIASSKILKYFTIDLNPNLLISSVQRSNNPKNQNEIDVSKPNPRKIAKILENTQRKRQNSKRLWNYNEKSIGSYKDFMFVRVVSVADKP